MTTDLRQRSEDRKTTPSPPDGSTPEPSPWSPLRAPLFRALWIANLASSIGAWMNEVAAAWLMTSLAPTPVMVAAVQAAATLPMFVLILPAGALADVADRRRLLIAAQVWTLVAALALAGVAFAGSMTAGALLVFTGLLAAGTALAAPAWQAILPGIVPRAQLPAAVALGSMSINAARAVGPALGGLVVSAAGPAAAFSLNALSVAGILWVLTRWRRERAHNDLPAERFLGALRTGFRYVRHAPRLRAVAVRAGAFTVAGSAVWALLPLFARQELGLGAGSYGGLLAVFGAGAVTGATQLHRLRRRFETDKLVRVATLMFAAALGGLAASPGPAWALLAMALGGVAWLLLLSSFNVAAQTVLPDWVRARALSGYLLVFFGSLALGSLGWGFAAGFLGLRRTFAVAAVAAAASVLLSGRFRLRGGEDLNLAPSRHWPTPGTATAIEGNQGPVMITVEYRVDPESRAEFRQAMERVRRARQRDGAYFWDLFFDIDDPERCLEVYLADSWLEHLRQHERVTEEDRASEARARRLVDGGRPVAVRHLVSVKRTNGR